MTSSSPHAGHFRFLHTSDWQLGMPARFLGEESSTRFAEARLAAVEKVFNVAKEQQCQAIVVAGDVFDSNLLRPEVYRRAMNVLERAPVPVFLLPGNHDPFDAASIYRQEDFERLSERREDGAPVVVLTDMEPVTVEAVGETSVQVVGAPLMSKKPSTDLVAQALAHVEEKHGPAQAGQIRVLVGHGGVSSFGDSFNVSEISVETASEACSRRVVDYVALGDTHSTQQLNDAGTVWYSGAHEVTDYLQPDGGGESHSGYALVVDITVDPEDAGSPATVEVTEHRTGQWAFLAMEADINNLEDAEDFIDKLRAVENQRHTSVKYALRGTIDLGTSAWLDDRIEELAPGFAALYERSRLMDLHVIPGENELASMDVGGGYMQVAAEELAVKSQDKDTAAADALRLLFRLNTTAVKEA